MTMLTLNMLFIIALGASVYFSFLYQKIGLYSLGKIDLFVLRCLCFYVYMFFILIAAFSFCPIAFPDLDFLNASLKNDSSSEVSLFSAFILVAFLFVLFVDVASDFIYGKYLDKVLKNSGEQVS